MNYSVWYEANQYELIYHILILAGWASRSQPSGWHHEVCHLYRVLQLNLIRNYWHFS
jgi:hypothetical protein